jgi:hypothetical protein
MPTQAKETNGIDLLRRTLGQMSRITPRKWATAHSMIVFTMVASLCLLLMAFIPMSGAVFASTGQISDATVARATGKGPRIASAVSFACKGQGWGHESSKCLAAILSQTYGQRAQPIRIIHIVANTNPEPDTYW